MKLCQLFNRATRVLSYTATFQRRSITSLLTSTYHALDENEELITRIRDTVKRDHISVLPKFLRPEVYTSLASFAEQSAAKLPHGGVHFTNPYYAQQDPTFPDDHPRNWQVSKSMKYVTLDDIPESSPLLQLHRSPRLRSFLQQVMGASLYDYGCELSKCVFSVQKEGDHQDWHFDNNQLTLTFMLQKPARGGAFEVIPQLRLASGDGENYDAVSEVLRTDRGSLDVSASAGVRRIEYALGDLIIFMGRHSLHRATRVEGKTTRIIGILSYSTEEGGAPPSREHLANVYGSTTGKAWAGGSAPK